MPLNLFVDEVAHIGPNGIEADLPGPLPVLREPGEALVEGRCADAGVVVLFVFAQGFSDAEFGDKYFLVFLSQHLQ